MVQLDREIGDYHRFANRRKVGCFGGVFPGSILLEHTNAWARLPKWVRPGSGL